MPLLVDAWNVLHQTGVLPPDMAGVGLKGLGRLIQGSRWGSGRVLLVCDGTPKSPHAGLPTGMHVAFSGPDREADDLIEAQISASTAPRLLTVVSSDRRIKAAARKRGCKVLTSSAFLERLVLDAQRPSRTTPKRPDKVDLPKDMIEEAKAMVNRVPEPAPEPDAVASPKKRQPKHAPSDDGPLPQSVIDEARRIMEDGQER